MEAAHGVVTGGDSTVFPCSLARAAAFDPALEEEIARAIGVEARAKWNDYQRVSEIPIQHCCEMLRLMVDLMAFWVHCCRLTATPRRTMPRGFH